ncbi:phage head morphogenesis protein [Arsenophonus sp. ENCA]|uniref:phage head morphogenesis protein n=1 Tax=Arsenophonus sp. ENCA TaxID=1987579 RepID=UPI0025BCC871|nr:phage head morphogenesis protein [Arsenophonus sp. ENCA]
MRKKKHRQGSVLSTHKRSKRAETQYRTSLNKIAREIGVIINQRYDGSNDSVLEIQQVLSDYSELIDSWAKRVATKFVDTVSQDNARLWQKNSHEMRREIKQLIAQAPVGHVVQSLVHEQIKYIKSLPIEAADRVYDIQNRAIKAVVNGERPEHFTAMIANSGNVTASRAKMLARTELGRATQALTQARALAIGSTGYIWRTAKRLSQKR